jgi:DNA polymerase-1
MQLISDKIAFFDIRKKSFCSLEDVYEKFLVLPEQICDYLALVGDRADNIPGIRGIGKKIASELLKNYQTLEGIYNNLNSLEDKKVKNLLENGYDLAILSKKLVLLKDSLNINKSLEAMYWKGFHSYSDTIETFLLEHSLENLITLLK